MINKAMQDVKPALANLDKIKNIILKQEMLIELQESLIYKYKETIESFVEAVIETDYLERETLLAMVEELKKLI